LPGVFDLREKLNENKFLTQRKESSEVVLEKFRKHLDEQTGKIPAETLLGKAVSYTFNQWDKLIACLDCAELTPDNNISENAINHCRACARIVLPFTMKRATNMILPADAGT
jgi:hypothetical protein